MLDIFSSLDALKLRLRKLIELKINCWFPLVKDERYFAAARNVPKLWYALSLSFEDFNELTKPPGMWTRPGIGGGWENVLKTWGVPY